VERGRAGRRGDRGLRHGVLLADETLEPIDALDRTAIQVAGAALAGAGIALTVMAQFAMGDSWRVGVDPDERTSLVTGGLFSIVRNPIYTGLVATFAGIALLAPNVLTIGGELLLIAAVELETRLLEEPYLARVHGREYTDYCGRFVPGLGRLRS